MPFAFLILFTVLIWKEAFWNYAKSLTTFYALVYKLLGFMLQNTSFYSLFVRNKRWQRKNIVSIKEKGHCKNYGICKYMYPFKKIKFLYSYRNSRAWKYPIICFKLLIIIVRLQNTQNLLYYYSNITRCLSCYITSKDLILSAQVQIRFFDLVRHTCDTPSVHNKIWYHSPSFLALVWSYLFICIQKTFVSTLFGTIR